MQKNPIKKYAYKTLIFSIIIAGLSVVMQLLFKEYITSAIAYVVLFFFVITLFCLYIVLRKDTGKEKTSFVSGYMLSRIIKFFSCLLFLVLYFIFCEKDRIKFAIAFMAIYFCYSVFEIYLLKKEQKEVSSNK